MCNGIFGAPAAPEIKYVGPSQGDIDRNNASLARYESQVAQQQADFSKQLNQQIAAAEAETARIQAQYDEELAAATAAAEGAGSMEANNVYAVSATQTPATGAETTAAIQKKKKPNSSLKIAIGGTPNRAGSGLNIGV